MGSDHLANFTTTFVDHGPDVTGQQGRIEKFKEADPLCGRTGFAIESRGTDADGTLFIHVLLDPAWHDAPNGRVDSVWVFSGEWLPA